MFTMQFTDLLIVHSFFSFYLSFSLFCSLLVFNDPENPLNKCAKMTRQINAPK